MCFCVIRGDPTLVKINVGITSGYLISGGCSFSQTSRHSTRMCFSYFPYTSVDPLSLSSVLLTSFPDLLLIFYYWKAIGDKFFVVHHLAALYAYYYVLVSSLLSNSRMGRQDGDTTKANSGVL